MCQKHFFSNKISASSANKVVGKRDNRIFVDKVGKLGGEIRRRRRDPVLSSLLVLLLCVAVLEQIYGLDLRNHLSTFYKTGHNHHHSQVACVYPKQKNQNIWQDFPSGCYLIICSFAIICLTVNVQETICCLEKSPLDASAFKNSFK